MDEQLKSRVVEILDVLEIDTREENVEHMGVLVEAMGLYISRNALYGDLWKKKGANDSLHHMESKFLRTQTLHMVIEQLQATGDGNKEAAAELLDSPLDLINYSAFYIQNVRAGR